MKQELGKHGWRSMCDPESTRTFYQTFSMSFFKWTPTTSGKGLKPKPIGYRLSGPCDKRDDVVKLADEIVVALDNGWKPTKKSETFKP